MSTGGHQHGGQHQPGPGGGKSFSLANDPVIVALTARVAALEAKVGTTTAGSGTPAPTPLTPPTPVGP
jgi:hypothetical protein